MAVPDARGNHVVRGIAAHRLSLPLRAYTMSTPVMTPTELQPATFMRPTSVLMLRTPVPPSQGTDPYHDAFGPFCLPSFPLSALESGSSTPLPPPISLTQMAPNDRAGADLLKNALKASATGRRKGRWIEDDATLTTHHMANDPDAAEVEGQEVPKKEFCVTSVPILGHRVLNADVLADRIMNGSLQEQDGVRRPFRGCIVTSQRAVEAWAEAVAMVAESIREGKRECGRRGEETDTQLTMSHARTGNHMAAKARLCCGASNRGSIASALQAAAAAGSNVARHGRWRYRDGRAARLVHYPAFQWAIGRSTWPGPRLGHRRGSTALPDRRQECLDDSRRTGGCYAADSRRGGHGVRDVPRSRLCYGLRRPF